MSMRCRTQMCVQFLLERGAAISENEQRSPRLDWTALSGCSPTSSTVSSFVLISCSTQLLTVVEMQVSAYPIIMTDYPHLYVIRITWTPTTYIGLALSVLIALNAWVLLGRWARATYRFGASEETWNLLRPIDLIAYSLTWHHLLPDVRSADQRRMAMRGETLTTLREHPRWEPAQSVDSPQTPTLTVVPGKSVD